MKRNRSSTQPAPADLINPAAAIVVAAGALLKAEFHRPVGPRGSGSKSPLDREIETFLRQRLLALHSCGWHGEETPRDASDHDDLWVVDPIDGTAAMLKGLRGSAISVALLRQRRPVLGIVYSPTAPDDLGDLFHWAEGLPPVRNGEVLSPIGPRPAPYRTEQADVAVQPAEPKPYSHDTVVALNEHAADYAAANHARLAPAAVLAIPSIAYRLALAAAGEADVAVSLTGGLDAYDIAGGHALLMAVGGDLIECDGRPISYEHGMTYNGCIGGRPELVSEVVRRGLTAASSTKRNPARPKRRIEPFLPLRRAQGALLGQLVGDSLGSLVEFKNPDEIRRAYPNGVQNLRPGGTWKLLAGQPTDDSEMALALSRTLCAVGKFDAGIVGEAYEGWGASKPFDIGMTTRAGIAALAGRGQPNAESQSNGALMRVSPIGIFAAGRPDLAAGLARQDAALTHPNPICIAASAAYASAIAAGVGGADNRTMWSIAHAHAGEDASGRTVRDCLERAIEARPDDFLSNQGWVLTALQNAFHWLWSGRPFEEALIETVGQGGDTDTNGAICGALLGAAQGRDAIPLRWRRLVLSCRAVEDPGVRHPRPAFYWADDAMDLAEALLVAGQA